MGAWPLLPVGGVKMKVLAAIVLDSRPYFCPGAMNGISKSCRDEVRQKLTFVLAETIDDVLHNALQPEEVEVELAGKD